MSLEQAYLSREGYGEITKITKFFKSLIVKNNTEAKEYETSEVLHNYYLYTSAYTDSKNPYDYDWSYKEVSKYFSDKTITLLNLMTPEGLSNALNNDIYSTEANMFMTYLQNKAINNYGEQNQYYRTFMGLPPTNDDIILVENLDNTKNDPELAQVRIDTITLDSHPNTYEYYFIKNKINDLIEQYPDLTYLRFITNKFSPYYLRSCPDFTILYCDKSILSTDEYNRFEQAYKRAQNYVNEMLYVVGMEDRFPLYANIMYLFILFYTFQIYNNLRLKDYSLTKYTEFDLYDILDSNNLSSLKNLSDKSLMRKVVMHMDILKEYKGSEYVLSLLFDLIADDTVTVKRYNLTKEYPVDLTNSLKFDTTKTYDNQVDLKFVEKVIRTAEAYYTPRTIDYDSHVESDDMWGGTKDITDDTSKAKIKKELKNKILGMNFSSLSTKYITISKSLNIYENSIQTANLLYLIMRYCHNEGIEHMGYNPLKEDKVRIDDSGNFVEPMTLFAAICYFQSIICGLENPSLISNDRCILANANILRSRGGIQSLIKEVENTELDISAEVLKKSISQILGNNSIENFLIKYDIDAGSTLVDVVNEYSTNEKIMSELSDLLVSSDDAEAYEAYYYLYEKNKVDYCFAGAFEGYTDYEDYINAKNPWFFNKIDLILASVEDWNDRKSLLETVGVKISDWLKVFQDYLTTLIKSIYTIDLLESERDVQYLEDLKMLLTEFLSIYSELYSMEHVTDVSDAPYNTLKLHYLQIYDILNEDLVDYIGLKIINNQDILRQIYSENISLAEKLSEELLISYSEELSLFIENNYDRLVEEYVDKAQLVIKKLEDILIESYKDEIEMFHLYEEVGEIISLIIEDKFEIFEEMEDIFVTSNDDVIEIKPIIDKDTIYEEYNDYIRIKDKIKIS